MEKLRKDVRAGRIRSLGELASKTGQPRNNYTQVDFYLDEIATISSLRILLPPSSLVVEKKLCQTA